MLRDGRRSLTIMVRESVFAALQRMAARDGLKMQGICDRILEAATEAEMVRELKMMAKEDATAVRVRAKSLTLAKAGLAELDNVAPRPEWLKKPE